MAVGVILNRMFRTKDNPLFEYIFQQQEDINECYFIIPTEDLSDASTLKKQFYFGTLQRFYDDLTKLKLSPFVMEYDDVITFCQQHQITEVVIAGDIMSYHHETYDILHQRHKYQQAQIKVTLIKGHHYFKPSRTKNKQHNYYQVFTSFYKQWRPFLRIQNLYHYDLKELQSIVISATGDYSSIYKNEGTTQQHEQDKWQQFLKNNINSYTSGRDYLPQLQTSQLSIALAYGVLDINEIFNDLLQMYDNSEENFEAFIRELMFREFYYILMTAYPETSNQAFKEKYRQIEWSDNQLHFDKWRQGQTGFPIIDAAMAELRQTGFMHNRMRMVVSQFLTKDLFIDWTLGEDEFRKYLIDYDAASNIHGWQWSASTGTDAVPYFRMFSPIRQSERFDKHAYYIKQYLPQLTAIDAKYLHDTHKYYQNISKQGVTIGVDYPEQIVNHNVQRQYVLETFKQLK
ncbi:deoxyribodipyrimidine photo-lyase [Staphylococcus simiae]|uniref:cryptochrome/photolyase family protein n=1 Tax=Staphylococcus simiae TaxID=308354 RepID=UPI001A967D2C|nr:deoxyribodipyrimidine photo-lyase [Staphylococcus simiae]MBO1198867.1 deoxyribodipyrimidine photo-lyase [Staphylococcus simiae]MBO1201064.1 deoxyribodipyrimidine photo-lyase [Staphylococcus simiae]MBO1204015.1 deoxyribodipyrimidine photo-lyase [Staphylococcus simiae]MBO1211104.1 deoxyribodipyrimidine photo-lyase [Staphylococcus simiae]MBO1229343.1 deoxyribodipyrimidine photo-lyase [Staphylococcus simiae]